MTATQSTPRESLPLSVAIDRACRRIAPTWPLDRFIAVNPFWGHRDRPASEVAAELATLSGERMLMSRAYFREQWNLGHLKHVDLAAAIEAAGAPETPEDLVVALDEPTFEPRPLTLWSQVADTMRRPEESQLFSDVVTHQVSQHAAAYFDRAQSAWSAPRDAGLYGSWRGWIGSDRGLPRRADAATTAQHIAALPGSAVACIQFVTDSFGIAPGDREAYFVALLSDVRGWASWCSYERWQAELEGGQDDHIVDLLAIRIAWEYLLVQDLELWSAVPAWHERLGQQGVATQRAVDAQRVDWLLQHAMEIAFQRPLIRGLSTSEREPQTSVRPDAQAAFCIDVRSERFRRALEAVSDGAVATRGFAGFFGLPIEFEPIGTGQARPQLPGLLAPAVRVTQCTGSESTDTELAARRAQKLSEGRLWGRFRSLGSSMFTFVESCGLIYAYKLVRNSLAKTASGRRPEDAGVDAEGLRQLRPAWSGHGAPSPAEQFDMAENVLRAMGLVSGFARLVLLTGHGSTSTNNPHKAGLDCGACGGQTGEVNARLLAQLLSDHDVRRSLAERGIQIPDDTQFIAGLHDTTTDELQLYDVDHLPSSHAEDLRRLRDRLAAAGDATRAERAPTLGLDVDDAAQLRKVMHQRAGDWSQVRPEWGLADNAAFVVAPRSRTSALNLGGRVFLHDYDHTTDTDDATLTLIMTAPMVVTNWINMQYYASTVDNLAFGSGNKVLHNVVGGNLGVFEGNGGDLRTGLAMQSLHDGNRWRHTPLRLSVFIEAPREAIEGVISDHETVRHLVDHGWLHLFQIDPNGVSHRRVPAGDWQESDSIVTPTSAAGGER